MYRIGVELLRTLGACLCILLASCNTVYLGWAYTTPKFESFDADLNGIVVGTDARSDSLEGFAELRVLEDRSNDMSLLELNFGARCRYEISDLLTWGPQVDIGLGSADVERFRNKNSLVSVGFGLFAEVDVGHDVSVFGFGGGRWYGDTTDPTTCQDGSTSESTGQGTCSHHGGILHANDPIGDGFGAEVSIGIRIRF